MGAKKRSRSTPGASGQQPVPRWTWIEVLGLVVSAVLIATPLLALAFSFAFPPTAPAQPLWPPPGSPTPTEMVTPTDTPAPTPTSEFPPTDTPTLTPTSEFPATDTPTPTPTDIVPPTHTPCGDLTVQKAANVDIAYPGETVVFSIGFTNQSCEDVTVGVTDQFSDQDYWPHVMSYSADWHTCAESSSITPGEYGFAAAMVVPAGQSCQIVVSVVVNSGCGCYVRNEAEWDATWGGVGHEGIAYSQPILLPMVPTATPTWTPTSTPGGPTDTPVPPTATPTGEVPPTATPGGPTDTPVPPTATPESPTDTPVPPTATPTGEVPPSLTPTGEVPPSLTPTGEVPPTLTPTGEVPLPDTPTPTPEAPVPNPTPWPTERPPQPTPEPTGAPPPPCAQARVSGNVCAAGVTVVISSCCPPWSAQTTSNANGAFEFGALTPGTYTVSAQGRSRTVRLDACDSAVTVNLCPAAPAPTVRETAGTVPPSGPTLTTTVTLPPSGTRLPTESYLLLENIGEDNVFQPGESVTLRLTLHNGETIRTFRGIIMGVTFDNALEVLGAASATGEVLLSGQRFVLTGATLGPMNNLVIYLDLAVRADTPSGTIIDLQGTARTDAGDMIDSNVLQIEVWGEGMAPPPAGGTPLGAVTPVGGGPEPLPTTVPSAPETQTPVLPPTSTGIPIVGVMLGSGVLLARQLRLRKAGQRKAE